MSQPSLLSAIAGILYAEDFQLSAKRLHELRERLSRENKIEVIKHPGKTQILVPFYNGAGFRAGLSAGLWLANSQENRLGTPDDVKAKKSRKR